MSQDLKEEHETWSEAFEKFIQTHIRQKRIKCILSGIQYFHDCRTQADTAQVIEAGIEIEEDDNTFETCVEESVEDVDDADRDIEGGLYTEEGLQRLNASLVSTKEELNARFAIEVAKMANIFERDQEHWQAQPQVVKGTANDILQLEAWKSQLKADVAAQSQTNMATGEDNEWTYTQQNDIGPSVQPIGPESVRIRENAPSAHLSAERPLAPLTANYLNKEQKRAHEIISWHLDQTLKQKNPPPLCMIIYGEGGTGKSRVIQTVTQTFEERGVIHWLIKSA
ncbi:MAG TPA: hypothetical protein VGO47_00665, partial [Chlamydiales bacterium]|nr:hypothetical protein [Chlamydiales bacterium]